MAVEIRVPPLGESLVDAVVGTWLKQEGDSVNRGDSLVELETDKVNLDVTAEEDGVLAHYPNLAEIVWAQEEPRNMGAWIYVEPRLRELLQEQGQGDRIERPLPLRYAGRPERASPAEGSLDRHGVEQARIIQTALADARSVAVAANGRGRGEKTNGAARNGARTKATRAKAS